MRKRLTTPNISQYLKGDEKSPPSLLLIRNFKRVTKSHPFLITSSSLDLSNIWRKTYPDLRRRRIHLDSFRLASFQQKKQGITQYKFGISFEWHTPYYLAKQYHFFHGWSELITT